MANDPGECVALLGQVTTDFLHRMEKAAEALDDLAEDAYLVSARENVRLRGKAEGIRLAMSYWRDAERFAPALATRPAPIPSVGET